LQVIHHDDERMTITSAAHEVYLGRHGAGFILRPHPERDLVLDPADWEESLHWVDRVAILRALPDTWEEFYDLEDPTDGHYGWATDGREAVLLFDAAASPLTTMEEYAEELATLAALAGVTMSLLSQREG